MANKRQPVYTPMQSRIISLLLDEKPHAAREVEALFPKTCSNPKGALTTNLVSIRRIIRPLGRDVMLIRAGGTTYYRLTDLSEFPPCDDQEDE